MISLCHGTHTEVRGYLLGVSSLLLLQDLSVMETHTDGFCAASTLAAEASRQILQCADAGKGSSL